MQRVYQILLREKLVTITENNNNNNNNNNDNLIEALIALRGVQEAEKEIAKLNDITENQDNSDSDNE